MKVPAIIANAANTLIKPRGFSIYDVAGCAFLAVVLFNASALAIAITAGLLLLGAYLLHKLA